MAFDEPIEVEIQFFVDQITHIDDIAGTYSLEVR